jgi:histone deacetylase 6
VDKIVTTGNELIDIVVPHQPATEEEKATLKEKVTELLTDIWDNFAATSARSRRVILLGAGYGCHSLVSFMNQRQKDVLAAVSCVVIIPGGEETLPQVTRRLSSWYMENSFVVVADDHPVWDKVDQPVTNRFGRIVRTGNTRC